MDTGRYAKLFLSESREHLTEINSALLELERGGSDTAVARLFRSVHTMKGMGAAMGYTSVGELSHELESLLDKLRNGTIAVTRPIIETLFASVDALEQAVDLATASTPQQLDVKAIIARIQQAASEETPQTFTSEFAITTTDKGNKLHRPDRLRKPRATSASIPSASTR